MNRTIASPRHGRRNGIAGFSLIELMVTVAVVAILASIALPAYMSSVRKSRRTEAKTALLDLAGREERYYNTNNSTYTALANNLGYGTAAVSTLAVGTGYYQVTISSPAANGVPAPSYELVAVPITADQLKDAQCLQFTLDSTGLQTATNAVCWQ